MAIRFLGEPIEFFDKLIKELNRTNDIVKIQISAYKYEELSFTDGRPPIQEEVRTFLNGRQIKSMKDIIQFDYEDMKI